MATTVTDVEVRFERPDLPADRARRDEQLGGRVLEAEAAGGDDEDTQRGEGGQGHAQSFA